MTLYFCVTGIHGPACNGSRDGKQLVLQYQSENETAKLKIELIQNGERKKSAGNIIAGNRQIKFQPNSRLENVKSDI